MRETKLPNSFHVDNIVDAYESARLDSVYNEHGSNKEYWSEFVTDNIAVKELLSFLYTNESIEFERDPFVIEYLTKYNYHKDILTQMEEYYLLFFKRRETIEYCIVEKFQKRQHDIFLSVKDDYILPKEIIKAICDMFPINDADKVYNPFAGFCSFGICKPDVTFISEEKDPAICALVKIRLAFNDNNVCLQNIDSLDSLNDNMYDNILSALPVKSSLDELANIVDRLYNALNENGCMGLLLPSSFLSDDIAFNIRKRITKDKSLKRVFLFPPKLMSSYKGNMSFILIEKNAKQEEVTFENSNGYAKRIDPDDLEKDAERYFDYDSYKNLRWNRYELDQMKDHPQWQGTDDFLKKVFVREIEDNDYYWHPSRYLLSDKEKYVHLQDVVKVVTTENVSIDNLSYIFEGWCDEYYWSIEVPENEKGSFRHSFYTSDDELYTLIERINPSAFIKNKENGRKEVSALMQKGGSYLIISEKGTYIGFVEHLQKDVYVCGNLSEQLIVLEVREEYTVSELAFILFEHSIIAQIKDQGFTKNFQNIVIPKLDSSEKQKLRSKYFKEAEINNGADYSVSSLYDKYSDARDDDEDSPGSKTIAAEIMVMMYALAVAYKGKDRYLLDRASQLGINYNNEILSYEEQTYLYKYHYQDVIEKCCHYFMISIPVSHYYNQKNSEDVLDWFCSNVPNKTVYNPFAGIASYAFERKESRMIMEEKDPLTCLVAQIRLDAYDIQNEVLCKDSMVSLKNEEEKYDYIVTTVPDKIDYNEIIPLLISKLSDEGRLDMIVNRSLLVDQKYASLRKRIVENENIGRIIALPNTYAYISIHNGCMFENIMMYDASDEGDEDGKFDARDLVYDSGLISSMHEDEEEEDYINYSLVPFDQIKDKKCLLSPITYSLTNNYDYLRLSDIAFNYPYKIKGSEICDDDYYLNGGHKLFNSEGEIVEIVEDDLCGFLGTEDLFRNILLEYPHKVIPAYTPFLIVSKNKYVFSNGLSKRFVVIDGFTVFIPKENYTPLQLIYMLKLPVVKNQIKANDLSNEVTDAIFVPGLSENERVSLVLENSIAARKKAEEALANSYEAYKIDTRMKKHAIGQSMANLSGYSILLKQAVEQGAIQTDYVLGKGHPMSVGTVLNNMSEMIGTISYLMTNFNICEEEMYKEVTNIDINKFIKDYTNFHEEPLYIGVRAFDAPDNVTIRFSEVALRQIFDNIISNAKDYGFENENSGDNKILFKTSLTEDFAEIIIANNGKPLSKDANPGNIFNFAWSSKLGKGHFGLGCYQVKKLMENFGGKVDVLINPIDQFTIGFSLKFPLNNNM